MGVAVLTVIQAAHSLGISPATVRQQIRNNKLHAEKFGSQWLLLPREIERYRAESLRRNGEEQTA